MESILTSIKKMLGISEEYTHFDADIIMHINTVFVTLKQIGVGPSKGFSIKDSSTTWDEYISEDLDLESVKTYIFLKVKLVFDPPASSIVTESFKRAASEIEWRLNIEVDSPTIESEDSDNNEGSGDSNVIIDWGNE